MYIQKNNRQFWKMHEFSDSHDHIYSGHMIYILSSQIISKTNFNFLCNLTIFIHKEITYLFTTGAFDIFIHACIFINHNNVLYCQHIKVSVSQYSGKQMVFFHGESRKNSTDPYRSCVLSQCLKLNAYCVYKNLKVFIMWFNIL